MPASDPFSLSIRRYDARSDVHRHDLAQFVLPLAGTLAIDISGHESLLDRGLAAYVEKGTRHEQASRQENRFLILDIDPDELGASIAERLSPCPFLRLTAEANHLIDYMGAAMDRGAVPPSRARLWLPLLLDALLGDEPRPRSRLARLLAAMDADPLTDWTTARMAAKAGVSVSRLHALFREELDTTPRAWLSRLRLDRVRAWLTATNLPIAELAYRGGYADQSALTRAMRKATGSTPAAYRRQARETGPKKGESRSRPEPAERR